TSVLTAASFSLLPALGCRTTPRRAPMRVRGANEDIRYAAVGCRSRGADHISGMREVKGTRLVALCDVDRTILDREVQKARDKGGNIQGYTDYRELLANPDIDVVTVATPNHWHALAAIWAVQAGKD